MGTDRLSSAEWLEEQTIREMQAAMEDGRVCAVDLVLGYMERISRYDKGGPRLNAVAEINPDALYIAEALDVERQTNGARGPLHGIPLLVKDNIDTGDKMHTTAGSVALAGTYAPGDAFVVTKLREAGAIVLGKTNLTEWANFMTEGMPNGYSSHGGQVLNPYGPGSLDVGGSSSGSGAAVAASLSAAAIGTETSGSILSPSNQNSIVGIKPTVGLISRNGIVPIAHSQDTAGPMARTVTDAALLLGAIAGPDPRDPVTLAGAHRAKRDYTAFLQVDGLDGARVGIVREYVDHLSSDARDLVETAIRTMAEAGAIIVDPVELPSVHDDWRYEVLLYEFKAALNAYLSARGPCGPVRTLEELIAYNQRHRDRALRYGQTILTDAEKTSGTLTEWKYVEAKIQDLRRSRHEGIDAALRAHQLDALVLPNTYGCHIAAKAGYPSVTVPAGYTSKGEPFGVTFTGTAYSEPTLIKFAYAYEQSSRCRQRPKLSADDQATN